MTEKKQRCDYPFMNIKKKKRKKKRKEKGKSKKEKVNIQMQVDEKKLLWKTIYEIKHTLEFKNPL